MTFDFETLAAAGSLVAFVSGLLLVFAWTQFDHGHAALRLSLSHLLGAGAIMLLASGVTQNSSLPVLAQLLFVAAAFLAFSSMLSLENRDKPAALYVVAFATLGLLVALTVLSSHADVVRMLQLAISATLFLASGLILWRGASEGLAAKLPLAILMFLHGLMTSVGLAEQVLRESLPSGIPSFSQWYGLVHLESMVYFIGTALFLVAMLKERSETRHKIAALTDPLTGLSNRRAFFSACVRILERSHRSGAPSSLLAVDLDRFKAVNDTFGHAIGDRVLRLFAEVASQQLRSFDVVGRLGGEEFAAILPRTHSREAASIANRLREAFALAATQVDEYQVQATLSIGVAVILAGDTTITEALERADAALYRAKLNGRNRVEVDTEVPRIHLVKASG